MKETGPGVGSLGSANAYSNQLYVPYIQVQKPFTQLTKDSRGC